MNSDEEVINELMKKDDGFNPQSPLPMQQQIAHKRRMYAQMLQERPIKDKIPLAFETILSLISEKLPPTEQETFLSQLEIAAAALASIPEATGKDLGLTEASFTLIHTIGEELLQQNNFAKSAAVFALLTMLDSKRYCYWLRLGQAERAERNYPAAIEAFTIANSISEQEPVCYLHLALCYAELGDHQRALECFEKAKNGNLEPWQTLVDEVSEVFQLKHL